MIFVTVGHQMPFDRLVTAVDQWALEQERTDIFAQIGNTTFEPRSIDWQSFIKPAEFSQLVADADIIVAHAGTGTMLKALELGTPILVMPRLARLNETRNDHQSATAQKFLELGMVTVAKDVHELHIHLNSLSELSCSRRISSNSPKKLLDALRGFIHNQDG